MALCPGPLEVEYGHFLVAVGLAPECHVVVDCGYKIIQTSGNRFHCLQSVVA